MALASTFTSEFKTQAGCIKSLSQKNIGGGFDFYCSSIGITRKEKFVNPETEEIEEQMVFPSGSELRAWLIKLYSSGGDLAYKEPNAQALKNMQLKGLTPKKQPSQIMNILVTSTDTSNIVLVHFPSNMKDILDIQVFLEDVRKVANYSLETHVSTEATDYLLTFTYENTEKTSFKESMTLEREFFQLLKKFKLMADDKDDDDDS
uniref:Uncharacterized protein n=1 Tax=viral metagenome TaxID=1070528 RepID=A0A6C0E9E8_9ZZZZ